MKKKILVRFAWILGLISIILITISISSQYMKKVYIVENGEINVKSGNEYHEEAWEFVKELLPNEYESYIKEFSLKSDGINGNLASVVSLNEENTAFDFEIDPKDILNRKGNIKNNQEVLYTMVHEYMHIITTCDKEMQFGDIVDGGTLVIAEGITKQDSYLNLFYQRFWAHLNDRLEEMEEAVGSSNKVNKIGMEIYKKYPDEFLNDYASSNPVEDIAESFAEFVLYDRPLGDKIVDEKVLFFYEFEELVDIRNEFRISIKELSKK